LATSEAPSDNLVKSWYLTYLGRAAQGGEENGWAKLLSQGQTEEQVLSQVLASPEFYARAQTLVASGTADQRYVQALSLLLLNRTGTPAEVAAWASAVSSQGRQGVALGILTSPEFLTDQLEGYYNALLHRPDDLLGLHALVSSPLDVEAVRIGFESSPEFFADA
jgi:hypothetical protein